MLAYLQGKILEKGLTYIILSAGDGNSGIGYKVFVTPETLGKNTGEEVKLFTYLKASEDGQSLFGLPDFETLQFFEQLITVSGVGPKVALAILSSAKVKAIRQAIANQDAAIFTRIAGIGTKIAEKIIVELKNKVGLAAGAGAGFSEVFDALLALGYSQREVREIVNKLDAALSTQEQLKQALKLLGKQ